MSNTHLPIFVRSVPCSGRLRHSVMNCCVIHTMKPCGDKRLSGRLCCRPVWHRRLRLCCRNFLACNVMCCPSPRDTMNHWYGPNCGKNDCTLPCLSCCRLCCYRLFLQQQQPQRGQWTIVTTVVLHQSTNRCIPRRRVRAGLN